MSNAKTKPDLEGKDKAKAGSTSAGSKKKTVKKKVAENVSKMESKKVPEAKSATKPKTVKKDNYILHREEIIRFASLGAACYNCPAKTICKELCAERNINTMTTTAPCYEAWLKWCEKREENC